MIEIGSFAPDFSLKDQNGQTFQLSKRKCGRVVISFHPLAWTGFCRDEILSFERYFSRFTKLDAVAVAISVDSDASKKAWAESLGVKKTALLADFWPHGEVAQRYGVFSEDDGFAKRASFIVDKTGRVAFSRLYEIEQVPDVAEILAVLAPSE